MRDTLWTNGEHLRVAEVKSFPAIPKSMTSVNGDQNGANLKKVVSLAGLHHKTKGETIKREMGVKHQGEDTEDLELTSGGGEFHRRHDEGMKEERYREEEQAASSTVPVLRRLYSHRLLTDFGMREES